MISFCSGPSGTPGIALSRKKVGLRGGDDKDNVDNTYGEADVDGDNKRWIIIIIIIIIFPVRSSYSHNTY